MGWITTAGLLLEAILLPSRNGGTLVPAVSLHPSIASKKPNEMQVCGSDSRDKLKFAVNK